MRPIPRDPIPDSALLLLRDPYRFIAKRCRVFGTELFEARILLRKTICMTGAEAARLFYDPTRFMRAGAAPIRLQKTIFERGGVQGLDGEAHRHRKAMFLELMSPEEIGRLARITAEWWRTFAVRWQTMTQVVLYDEVRALLTRAVCGWAGVPLAESEVERHARELTALFDYAGRVGPKHWWSRRACGRAERWLAELVDAVRAGRVAAAPGTAIYVIAAHRGLNGELLDRRVAAVELLNVLRPTVAIAVYTVFIAHALYQFPHSRAEEEELFVHEVRRFYPFVPAVVARVRERFEWNGYEFPGGCRVMLDLFGTNHDPRTWDERGVPAREVPHVGQQRVQLHPAGRRPPRHRPSLRGRAHHDRADESRVPLSVSGDRLRRSAPKPDHQ